MSEPNDKQPKLSREEWLRWQADARSKAEKGAMEEQWKEEEWERRALRGRSQLKDEEDAAGLLAEIDEAIADRYNRQAPESRNRKNRFRRYGLAMAASLLTLLAAAWWFWLRPPAPETLYAEFFTHFDNALTITPMGEASTEDMRTEVMRPYDARLYGEAAAAMEQYLAAHPDDGALRLYYGISLLESGQTEEAETELRKALQATMPPGYRHAARWYLALAFVRAGQFEAARADLKEIAASESPFSRRATALLGRIP